uniref:Uncharacterized protein n=1 Tax=Phaeomonas parva TaxID=124430 RepID=A0A7S1U6X7_9STRA
MEAYFDLPVSDAGGLGSGPGFGLGLGSPEPDELMGFVLGEADDEFDAALPPMAAGARVARTRPAAEITPHESILADAPDELQRIVDEAIAGATGDRAGVESLSDPEVQERFAAVCDFALNNPRGRLCGIDRDARNLVRFAVGLPGPRVNWGMRTKLDEGASAGAAEPRRDLVGVLCYCDWDELYEGAEAAVSGGAEGLRIGER